MAFDLPTQTGYDADHALGPGRGRQGRRAHRPHRRLGGALRGHPAGPHEHVDDHQRHGRLAAGPLPGDGGAGRGRRRRSSQGTTQNDIIKEYLSRGTYVFPPEASMRLISDMVAYSVDAIPKWNPINVCSYHLQEARRDAGAGDRVRAWRRPSPCSTRCARDDVPDERDAARGRPHLVLPELRHPLRRGDLQGAAR